MIENKKLFESKWVRIGVYTALVFGILGGAIYYSQYNSNLLINQIWYENNLNCNESVPMKAINKFTGEVKQFPSSCHIPRGWERHTITADASSQSGRVYRNEDYGFEFDLPSSVRGYDYYYNGRVDYVAVYLADQADANLFVYPKGSQDLLNPEDAPKESSFSVLGGKEVNVKKWNLPDGRSLIRYVFPESINSKWNNCFKFDNPDINCSRIDLIAGDKDFEARLLSTISSMRFFDPPAQAKTNSPVYFYADNRIRLYNPSSGAQTSKALSGLGNFATIKKTAGNEVVYLNNDTVSLFNLDSEQTQNLFARNTENDITYVPDNFVLSPDYSKIAIGYRYGDISDINTCGSRCQNVKAGVLVLDLNTGLTKASFDVPVRAAPIAWINNDIVLAEWNNTNRMSAVLENGEVNSSFRAPASLFPTASTGNTIIDSTGAVDIRTQQDRFGSGSYLFVNGKEVYKTSLGGINLIQN